MENLPKILPNSCPKSTTKRIPFIVADTGILSQIYYDVRTQLEESALLMTFNWVEQPLLYALLSLVACANEEEWRCLGRNEERKGAAAGAQGGQTGD